MKAGSPFTPKAVRSKERYNQFLTYLQFGLSVAILVIVFGPLL